MLITKDLFDEIPRGEIFKVVVTRFQNISDPLHRTLKFVCKKSDGPDNSWAVYAGDHMHEDWHVAQHGDKVHTRDAIKVLAGVDDEVMKQYRH